MCGFVVIVNPTPLHRRALERMLDSIRSRGPDDTRYHRTEWFTLGFCRLAIVSLGDAGQQPISNNDGTVQLAFNGEIYNYCSLRSQVAQRTGLEPSSEAGTLLSLYENVGLSFVSQLEGDFAILVLDSRTRTCIAIRDRFGVKPLYYAHMASSRTWIFASHTKSIIQCPGFSTKLDVTALTEQQVIGFSSTDRTSFEGISQVPPAHYMEVGADTVNETARRIRYTPVNCLDGPIAGYPDIMSLGEECQRTLKSALLKRLDHSQVYPLVLATSGGIDSSLLAALAAAAERNCVVATLTVFDSDGLQDRVFAKMLASDLGLQHQEFKINPLSLKEEFANIVLEMASTSPTYFPYFLGLATKHFWPQAKVLLCGEGADELFIGYPVYFHSQAFGAECLDKLSPVHWHQVSGSPLLSRVREWGTMSAPDVWYDMVRMFQEEQLVNRHLVPFDHGTMAHGLECRVPFLDQHVAEFIAKVPPPLRVLNDTPKVLLRMLLAQTLALRKDLANALLRRRGSPAFLSTLACREWILQFMQTALPGTRLSRSRLREFALDEEHLFWLASIQVVHLNHRGAIDGMHFSDLANEALLIDEV